MTNVLLVDDHLIFRTALKNLLENRLPKDKFKIVGAVGNGVECLDFISSHNVDLVLLDIEMPVMNGLVCAAKISKFPQIKVAMLTMHAEYGTIKKAIELGVSGYFIKSISPEELIDGIITISKGAEVFPEEVKRILISGLRISKTSPSKSSKFLFDALSPRELEIMKLISEGRTTSEISNILALSIHTVNNHRKNITSKLEAKNITELISHFNDWKESKY